MHWFLKFILGMKLYMFGTVPLSIIRRFSLYTQHLYMSYSFADSLRAGSGWKLYMFRTVPLSIIRSFSLYTQHLYMSYSFADSLRAGSGWNAVPSWSCSQAVSKILWHIQMLCVQWKPSDDGQRYCPKHVDFHSKNKSEKLMHLVGFIIRNLSRCTVTWRSNKICHNLSNFFENNIYVLVMSSKL